MANRTDFRYGSGIERVTNFGYVKDWADQISGMVGNKWILTRGYFKKALKSGVSVVFWQPFNFVAVSNLNTFCLSGDAITTSN